MREVIDIYVDPVFGTTLVIGSDKRADIFDRDEKGIGKEYWGARGPGYAERGFIDVGHGMKPQYPTI